MPDEDHQQKINRQKYFEIASVIILILVGFGYMAISSGRNAAPGDGTSTIANLSALIEGQGFQVLGSSMALTREFHGFSEQGDILNTSVELVSPESGQDAEAIIFAVGHPQGTPFPSDDVAEAAVQAAFDRVAKLGEVLVPSSSQGLSTAVNTTVEVSSGAVRYLKGVAQTSNGWKITYVAYREYEGGGGQVPLLLFVYQRLDAASDPALEDFNQVLFTAVNESTNIKQAMIAHEQGVNAQ